MSTLFAMSEVALFGRDLTGSAGTTEGVDSTSTGLPPTSTVASTFSWAMPEPSLGSGQPARRRINSADLEDMMMRAAVGLGFDRAGANLDEGSPLSREDLIEEETSGLPASTSSRGSSPLYRKPDYQLEHTLDTTAPSSPCTPSVEIPSLSAVSPTSSRSEEAAFQHQMSPQSASQAVQAILPAAIRPAVQVHNNASSTSGRFGLKLLVSNSMAGTLIGKGGTRICEIKEECSADIKVTPNGKFYPGTHERVVLVVGEPGSVQLACDRIVTTIYTAADTSLDITQRVLIPDAASGLIIGHDGGRLGDLRQEAGVASIQVSPRDMCTVAGERVVTLQGAMSAVIYGLSLIVDRMMEDTTASRYQNMSTIYRAVHLHLPPYAVPGMHEHGGQGGHSPRHPHPRMSPSYGGPPSVQQHDFHNPNALMGPRTGGGGRDFGNGHGASHWEYGYNGGGSRELHGAGVGAGSGRGSGPVEYLHRIVPALDGGSPIHLHHVNPHIGRTHMRQSDIPLGPRDYDHECAGEGEYSPRCSVDHAAVVDELRCRVREYDSPSHADLRVSREYSPRAARAPCVPTGDYDPLRHPTAGQTRAFGRGYHGDAQENGAFHTLQQQQQRLRQAHHLTRASADYAQDGVCHPASAPASTGMGNSSLGGGNGLFGHEARAAAVAAAAAAAARRAHDAPQHQGRVSPSLLSSHSGSGLNGMGAAPGELRRVASGNGNGHGNGDSGLAAMFEGMNLNSSHGLGAPPGSSQQAPQHHPQQQSQQSCHTGSNAAGVVVQGELPVPDADVGIILGKGGATVRELQQLSGAKIMIARRNEFMPGTKHRLVTLAGSPMSVNMARYLILRKIQTEKEKL